MPTAICTILRRTRKLTERHPAMRSPLNFFEKLVPTSTSVCPLEVYCAAKSQRRTMLLGENLNRELTSLFTTANTTLPIMPLFVGVWYE